MRTAKKQAAKRLLKKLSALRATLPDDEREILDGYIVVDEVEAHRLKTRVAQKTLGRVAMKADGKVKEVEAHRLKSRVAQKTFGRVAMKADGKVAEVEAHRLKSRVAQKVFGKVAQQRIRFNDATEQYEQID